MLYRILLIRKWLLSAQHLRVLHEMDEGRPEGFSFFRNKKIRDSSFQQGVFFFIILIHPGGLGNNEGFRDYHDSYFSFPGNIARLLSRKNNKIRNFFRTLGRFVRRHLNTHKEELKTVAKRPSCRQTLKRIETFPFPPGQTHKKGVDLPRY